MKGSRKKPGTGTSEDARKATQAAADDDARFAHIRQDPIFRPVPKDKKRINIDSRFGAMFHDDKFKLKYKVDKRGKPTNLTSDENLKRYYNLIEDEDGQNDDGSPDEGQASLVRKSEDESLTEIDDTKPSEERSEEVEARVSVSADSLSEKKKKKLQDLTVDYARGEGILDSDSEDEDDSSTSEDSASSEEEDEGIEDLAHAWGELDRDAERTDEVTHRLAVCNMDWDRVKSDDLMVLFHSFLPPGGAFKYVAIYPSEFGKKRLEEEEVHGPRELREDEDGNPLEDSDSDDHDGAGAELLREDQASDNEIPEGFVADEGEEGNSFHMERLRKYQLNRLKYYYAVMEFDSAETANKIYTECDGFEFESSATKIDLRFIPDDLTFDEEPRDKCDSLPSTEKYIPKFFTTTALQQMKVDLTWDETDPQRQMLTKRVYDPKEKVDDEDLRAYLASSSDDDEEADIVKKEEADEENPDDDAKPNDAIRKYRNLLETIQDEEKKKKEKDVELEITWGVGLKKTTEGLVKKKLGEEKAKQMTPWEEMLAKKHEKKKIKKKLGKGNDNDEANLEDSSEDATDDDTDGTEEEKEDVQQPFSDDDVDIDLNDPFFKDELQSSKSVKQKKKSKLKQADHSKDPQKSKQEAEDAAALELLLMDNEENQKKGHFSLKKILEAEQNEGASDKKSKKKRKQKKKKARTEEDDPDAPAAGNADNFQIDLEDDRFSALYTSHKFNVDPSDPNFKNTKAMGAIISEKQKRRHTAPEKSKEELISKDGGSESAMEGQGPAINEPEPPTKISRKSELASLVKSIKRNTENMKQKKNKFAISQKKTSNT